MKTFANEFGDLEKFFQKKFFSPKMRLRTKFSRNFCFIKRDLEKFSNTLSVFTLGPISSRNSEKRSG